MESPKRTGQWSGTARIAVIGDVHLRFDREDVRALDAQDYDLVLFVGDLAGYHKGAEGVARVIATLRTPALVIPGNHDGVSLAHLAAETFEQPRLAAVLGRNQGSRCASLARALSPVPLVGYSRHEFDLSGVGLSVIAARPHSQGGSFFAFARYLGKRYGVHSFEQSAQRLCDLVDEAEHEALLFLGHNGPFGLGARREDIWGCDFKPEQGDFGDRDLARAVSHALRGGRRVLGVVAGHMHHRLKGGGQRQWCVRKGGVTYLNAARVPRIEASPEGPRRWHLCLQTDGQRLSAEWCEIRGMPEQVGSTRQETE